MTLFSYIVSHDTGFAPNPFHGYLTLACCKPVIRRIARVGDWVLGLSPGSARIVYAMLVAWRLRFDQYWSDPRFEAKKPDMTAAGEVARRGDNIYRPTRQDEYGQQPSRHSHPDGTENPRTKASDLGGEFVLVADDFVYFGGTGPVLPEELAFLKVGRGHRSQFRPEQVETVVRWLSCLPRGVRGQPRDWPPDAGGCQGRA